MALLFADAPVARGVPNAADGTLSITVGADPEVFDRIAPWLGYMGSDVAYCGPVGTGTVMKLMNNRILIILSSLTSIIRKLMKVLLTRFLPNTQLYTPIKQSPPTPPAPTY